jgi:hypothetical protein
MPLDPTDDKDNSLSKIQPLDQKKMIEYLVTSYRKRNVSPSSKKNEKLILKQTLCKELHAK